MRARRRGFSLIEIIAVLAILSLLAAAATLSARQPIADARRRLAIEQVLLVDQLTRDLAIRQQRPVHVRVDVETGSILRVDSEDADRAAILASELPIAEVVVEGRSSMAGVVEWTCRPDGSTPSYAVCVSGGEPLWLFVAGGTGQTEQFQDEESVEAIFTAFASSAGAD